MTQRKTSTVLQLLAATGVILGLAAPTVGAGVTYRWHPLSSDSGLLVSRGKLVFVDSAYRSGHANFDLNHSTYDSGPAGGDNDFS